MAERHDMARADYAASVPAVARALAVIDCLSAAAEPVALQPLSRQLGISPSSLLAILRTLAAHGWVERLEPADAGRQPRYRLDRAAHQRADLAAVRETIGAATDALTRLIEAAARALPEHPTQPDGATPAIRVLAAAARTITAALVPNDTEHHSAPPTNLPPRGLQSAVVSPSPRGLQSAGLPPPPQSAEVPPSGRPADAVPTGALSADELDEFLAGAWLATLACIKPDGYPSSVPVWYHWAERRFWIVPRARSEWVDYLTAEPRVSLAIGEPAAPLRRVLVEGRAELIAGTEGAERATALLAAMAARYGAPEAATLLAPAGGAARGPARVVAIAPVKLVTWRGLAPHPRYHHPPGAGHETAETPRPPSTQRTG